MSPGLSVAAPAPARHRPGRRPRASLRRAPWELSFRSAATRRRGPQSSSARGAPAPGIDFRAEPGLSVAPSWWEPRSAAYAAFGHGPPHRRPCPVTAIPDTARPGLSFAGRRESVLPDNLLFPANILCRLLGHSTTLATTTGWKMTEFVRRADAMSKRAATSFARDKTRHKTGNDQRRVDRDAARYGPLEYASRNSRALSSPGRGCNRRSTSG